MTRPADKFSEVLKKLGIFELTRPEALAELLCAQCGEPADKFKDDISHREYKISGLCQKCQDRIFG